MTRRRDLNLPAGWGPTVHSTVQVLESATLAPAGVDVRGAWRCIHPAPAGCWWLLAADEPARRWLAAHGARVGAQSGMVAAHRLRLVPAWLQLPVPGT
jgi:hypothetical protein